MILVDSTGDVHYDTVEEPDKNVSFAISQSGIVYHRNMDILYRFEEDGTLVMFDISSKPFTKITLTTVERDMFKQRLDVYTQDYHITMAGETMARAYGDNAVIDFPVELIHRW